MCACLHARLCARLRSCVLCNLPVQLQGEAREDVNAAFEGEPRCLPAHHKHTPPGPTNSPALTHTWHPNVLYAFFIHPATSDIVATMAKALGAAKGWAINGTMNADVLKENYDCVTDTIPWWGNFSGPCCKPKA